MGPCAVVGSLLFVLVCAFFFGRWRLPETPYQAGCFLEAAALIPAVLALAVMMVATYELLLHAPGSRASPGLLITANVLVGLIGAGVAALLRTFVPFRDVFISVLQGTFDGQFGNLPGDVYRDAKAALGENNYRSRADPRRPVLDDWGWADRRERTRWISNAVEARRQGQVVPPPSTRTTP